MTDVWKRARGPVAAAGAAALLVSTLAACGAGSDNQAVTKGADLPDTVKVVSINPKTGVIAFVGSSANKGYRLAIDEINEQNFLGDTDIELALADTKSEPQTAAQELTTAMADGDVSAVFGSVSSQDAVAMSPVAQKQGMPIVYTQAGSDGVIIGDYTYRATPLMDSYYSALERWLKESGWKSIGVVYGESYPSVQHVGSKTLPDIAGEAGIDVVSSVGTPSTTQNFSAPISQALEAEPDGVSILQSGPANVTAMTQLRQAGYEGDVIGNPGAGGGTLVEAGEAGKGMVWPTDFHPDQSAKSSQAFVKAYNKEYDELPLNYAAEAYDAAWFLARAIKEADTSYRESIKNAMATVAEKPFDGALGEDLHWVDQEIQIPGVVVRWNGAKEELLYEFNGG